MWAKLIRYWKIIRFGFQKHTISYGYDARRADGLQSNA